MCANSEDVLAKLNVPYAVCEMLVSMVTVAGNTLVLIAFKRERKLRRRTNYYIVSLAMADLLVGLIGIPCAILSSVGLPKQIAGCLVSLSLLVVLCTISIFSLVAVSVDRYWAVLHPMSYTRNVTSKFALGIICLCWIAGGLVGFLPLFGWHTHVAAHEDCSFTKIMSYNYLVFLYFATIVGPALLLAAFYSHIYNVILKQLRQMVTMSETASFNNGLNNSTSVHILSEARRKEVKATQNLSVIVLFFILCWMPLYTINCIQAFCPECVVPGNVLNSCIILSHLNSAGNPLLYAYRLSDFRNAFRSLFFGSVTSSAENVIFAGRHEHDTSDFERSFAKSRNASVAFDPQKFIFAKGTPKLFKFGERESNSDVNMSPMRAKVARSDSSEQFLASDQSTRRYDFDRSISRYTQHSLEGGSHPENRYPYFNSDYVDELPYDCNGRKRIRSVLEDPSYILMINDDNISERTDGTDENNSSKLNVFETRKKILRRHSTNI